MRARKLLFGDTRYGELNLLLADYRDTRIGAKSDAGVCRRIAGEPGLAPGKILFLSDSEMELDAAGAVGMQTRWLVRDMAPAAAAHRQLRSLAEIEV